MTTCHDLTTDGVLSLEYAEKSHPKIAEKMMG
jgi:hypothetical protein